MEMANIFVLMAICISIANGSELRNLSEGVKTFYHLADNDLKTDDLLEIMEYLEQRFHRKCFSVEHGIPADIRRKDVIDILVNFEKDLKKLSSDISDDRTRFQNEISDVVEDQSRFQNEISDLKADVKQLSSDIVGDRIEISDIQKRFLTFENETKNRGAKSEKEFVRSNIFCKTEEYKKCFAGECCIETEMTYRNLALGKQAYQSSDYGGGQRAEKAVDGNRATISHTLLETTPWWMVDLGTERPVARVIITNRADGSWTRLRNVAVTVSSDRDRDGAVCGRFNGPGAKGQIILITCTEKLRGRFVKLTMNSRNYLHVGEVEVYSQ